MDVKTAKEFFEKVLLEKFNSEKAKDINCIVQMNLEGANGGDWIITITNQKIEVQEGLHATPSVTVRMKDSDYLDMVNGKLNGDRAFITGKLKFKGNISTAMKLRGLGII